MLARLTQKAQTLRNEVLAARLLLGHERVPKRARWLLGLAVAYALSPVDLIPDFIPVLGHLDDALIVGGLAALAFRLAPPDVLAECRARAQLESLPGAWTSE